MAKLKLINDNNRYGCGKSDTSGLSHVVANLSEVSKYILNNKYSFLVVICCFIVIPVFSNNPYSSGDQRVVANDRESRKLFGGYRITPQYCKATRASRFNHGPTICMFNHECKRREGEVVGACMDGFLFGACCQLKESADLTIAEGPGVVMTGYLDKYDEEIDVSDQSASFDDHFNFADPNSKPTTEKDLYATKTVEDMASTKLSTEIRTTDLDLTNSFDNYHQLSTEKINSDILTDGVNQIADSLLNGPSQADRDQIYNHSNLGQNSNTLAETILYHTNGTEVNDVVRPSDFEPMNGEVQISSLQTKPTMSSNIPTSKQTTTPATLYTHKPIYQKPIFKPKPVKNNANTDKFVLVQTMSKPGTENPISTSGSDYVPSIDSIIQMLNESSPTKIASESTTGVTLEHKDVSLSPPVTIPPISYSSGYPSSYITQPYYSSTGGHFITTFKPPSTSYVYGSTISKRPVFIENVTNKPPDYHTGKPGATTINNQYFLSTNSIRDEEKLTTLNYITSSQSTTTRKPPSTSYVYNPISSIRPESNLPAIIHQPSFDLPVSEDNFASVTPTVIVLGNLSPPNPKPSFQRINGTIKDPQITDNFIQISQEPYKKPVSQVTINNVISSTHNIHLNGNYKPVADVKPPPTVVITPKPSSTTSINNKITRKPIKSGSTTPSSINNLSSTVLIQTTNKLPQVTNQLSTSGTLFVTSTKNPTQNPTTFKPELQTSPDDLMNFPPVRNPNLNATGSNPAMFFNGTASLNDDFAVLQDVEFTTPSFLQEDGVLNQKMNVFVSKIVGSLQGTFQELHDIVILNKQSNSSVTPLKPTTAKPVRKPTVTTKKPTNTTKKPTRVTSTTKRPTKKPTRVTVATRKPTTTIITTTTKRPRVTTKKPTKPTKRVTTTTTTAAPTTTTTTTTTSQYFADDITTEAEIDDSHIDYSDERLCGIRPLVKSGRIVGGKGAIYGEFPWQVLVRESTWLGLFTKNKCGGVLISSRYVTTAAHCQPGFLASLVAVFGEHDISGDRERRRTVSKNVRRVIVHRQYDAATFENDLALLELDSPLAFDAHIVPICMPPDEADFTGRMATVTGWGRLKYGGGVPAVLQEVQVPVIENSVCQEMFQTAGHSKVILNSFMCAGYANGQKDSCEGDSGGPLVLQRPDGRWQLVGTVSHGIKCAAPYLPGVYMRTTFYKPWLKSITGVK